MKTLSTMAVSALSASAIGVAWAQSADMMDNGMWGDGWMGGSGGPLLLAIVAVGLVVWVVRRQRK